MKLLVTGSRTIDDKIFVYQCLDNTREKNNFDTIIEGDADGVDKLSGLYANEHGLKLIKNRPLWGKYKPKNKKHKNPAALIRNKEMVQECDEGIAIWDGKSTGTAHCIRELMKADKLLNIFHYIKEVEKN